MPSRKKQYLTKKVKVHHRLFFVLYGGRYNSVFYNQILDFFVHLMLDLVNDGKLYHEGNSLSWSNTHYSRSQPFVERSHTLANQLRLNWIFYLIGDEIFSDMHKSRKPPFTSRIGSALDSRLDSINRSIRHRSHSSRKTTQ